MGLEDLQGMAVNWVEDNCGSCSGADLNGDRAVTREDFAILTANWLAAF